MKRFVSWVLILVMVVSLLAGCGSTEKKVEAENEAAVNQVAEDPQDVTAVEEETAEETEEVYIDPYLDVAVDGKTLLDYVTEVEITVDNWQEFFHTAERVDEYGGEHASKYFEICVNDGYFLDEDVVFEVAYNEITNYTNILPEYGPSTSIFDEYVEADEVEVTAYSGTGIIKSIYIYDEMDDGVINEIVTEITDFTCSSVSGKLYSMQIPEEMWLEENGTQMIYLKIDVEGEVFTMGYENTPEDLSDLWEYLKSECM